MLTKETAPASPIRPMVTFKVFPSSTDRPKSMIMVHFKDLKSRVPLRGLLIFEPLCIFKQSFVNVINISQCVFI